jgi:hypothetical protein
MYYENDIENRFNEIRALFDKAKEISDDLAVILINKNDPLIDEYRELSKQEEQFTDETPDDVVDKVYNRMDEINRMTQYYDGVLDYLGDIKWD